VIRSLSILTIAILSLIVGFILWKGLRYSSETRSKVLPISEAAPEGLSIVVNPSTELKSLEYDVLRGMYTDEFINWSKIDAEDSDLLPIAVDPATPEGAAAARLVFGDASPSWGGLVQNVPSAAEAVARVASTPGAVAIVPAAAAAGRKDLRALPLRRVAAAANVSALALVGNRQVEDLGDDAISALLSGKTTNWKEIGGPDLAVSRIAPPAGSSLALVLEGAGIKASGRPGQAASDGGASWIEAIAATPGAAGYAFAEDLAARDDKLAAAGASDPEGGGIGRLVRVGRESGWNLTPAYVVEEPRLSGRVGGISTIILNTLAMLLLTLAMAAPLGVAAAVYLVEYAKQGPLLRILRLGTETLAGIPSIIFGLFGFLFFVNILHFGFGLLSGCLTLTLMILPTIVRTSEEALKSVPRALREGSLALGASRLQTIGKVVIPAAAPGILTGLILAIGRAVGETAALLFTMGSDYKAARGLFSSARVLSAHVYLLFAEGISFDRAFSTATVLIVIVLIFNFAAKLLVGRMGRNSLR
jgi:phosphate transport system permease protein